MPAMAPEVLVDPIGVVVDLVADVEPALDRTVIEDAVSSVAGGRAKRRRLAQALLDGPTVLTDGRSPAPRVVADLLIALRTAGAANISPPVCAECGKHLRTFQRRGRTGTAAFAGRDRTGARLAATSGSSPPVIGGDGRAAASAPTTTIGIRWRSSPTWSPSWTHRCRWTPSLRRPPGSSPGPLTCRGWPGPSKRHRSC